METAVARLDTIDYHLLRLLQFNSKVTNAYLSQKIGLSQAAIFERVRKLENYGYIKNYYAQIDSAKAGLGITFFVQVTLAASKKTYVDKFLAKVNSLDEVVECHHITGSGNFLLKVVSRNLATFEKFIMEEMSSLDEISNLESMVVLSCMKDSKVLPLPQEAD